MKNETARREIESLDYYLQNHTDDYSEESHTAMMMAIDALSNSEKPNKWIPVSERLPEDHENVLIWLKSNHITIGLYNSHKLPCDDRPIGWGVDAEISVHNFCSDDVLAWMPLPEPYEPQEWREIENDT